VPSSGIHSNGLTLARRALPELAEAPPELSGRSVGDALLEPTAIYVRAVRDLLASEVETHGLAHITGEGFLNLLRLGAPVGFEIDRPLPVPPLFELIADRGGVGPAELWQTFNMGCGFSVVVPEADAEAAIRILSARHPGTAVIGRATEAEGEVELPRAGLVGRREAGFAARS